MNKSYVIYITGPDLDETGWIEYLGDRIVGKTFSLHRAKRFSEEELKKYERFYIKLDYRIFEW